MINMGQDTKDKAMEKHLRAMLASWIEGVVCTQRWSSLSPWGSNRYMANAAGVAVLAAKALPDMRDKYNCFAVSQPITSGRQWSVVHCRCR
jgi:hypothetical protein